MIKAAKKLRKMEPLPSIRFTEQQIDMLGMMKVTYVVLGHFFFAAIKYLKSLTTDEVLLKITILFILQAPVECELFWCLRKPEEP